jgi:predicted DNA-binding WGR domain protein
VLARIDTMLARGEDSALDVELGLEPIAPPAALPSPPAPAAAPPSASQQASCELHFEQGSSCKFWRASLDDCELSISWGRVGSSGQSMLKQFDTPERARREMEKLIDEKRRKGYVDKPAQDTDPASGAA